LLSYSQQQETSLSQLITELEQKLIATRSSLEQTIDERLQQAAKTVDDDFNSKVYLLDSASENNS
jgi:hypothetical protein